MGLASTSRTNFVTFGIMKTLFFPVLLLMVSACSTDEKGNSEDKPKTENTQPTDSVPQEVNVVDVNHNEMSGVYQNVASSKVHMDFLPDGENNYIARYRVDGQSDFYFPSVNGYLMQGDVANHFSGPFQAVGPEGYFKMIDGKRHFYHELSAAYQAPEDTTAMLFVKVAELDGSQAITKEERNGLEGPVNMNQRYVIGVASKLTKKGNDWILSFEKTPREVEYEYGQKEFIVKTKGSSASVNNFLKTYSTKEQSVNGKILRIVFDANGTVPGECVQEPNGSMSCPIAKEIVVIE